MVTMSMVLLWLWSYSNNFFIEVKLEHDEIYMYIVIIAVNGNQNGLVTNILQNLFDRTENLIAVHLIYLIKFCQVRISMWQISHIQ